MGNQNLEIKSEFFKLAEFTRSATADRLHINNYPTKEVVENIQYGVDMVLDPLRRLYKKPIVIGSGFRCPAVNKAVGGVPNSWHQLGCAADLRIFSDEDAKLKFELLKTLPSVDTVLFEHNGKGGKWLHVQWSKEKQPRHHFNFNYLAK